MSLSVVFLLSPRLSFFALCLQSASSATAVAAAVVAKTQKNFESKFILIYDEFSLVLL